MKNDQNLYELRHGILRLPEEPGATIPSCHCVSVLGGDLWLFSQTYWEAIINKLAKAGPSPEKDALLRTTVARAVEAHSSTGCIALPNPIQANLGPKPAVFLDGKQIGAIISRD